MDVVNIWELNKVAVRPSEDFLRMINILIHDRFGSKERFFTLLEYKGITVKTFRNLLQYSYYKKDHCVSLSLFLAICKKLKISRFVLQNNILAYKTKRGYNIIKNPILPIKITPIFDMLLAHNIGDGTVINSKKGRQIYFGYRQFDNYFRLSYIKKLESIFGSIIFSKDYFLKSTRSYCPAVLSSLFFNYYKLNSKSFLSKQARLPRKLLKKPKEHLLAVLLGFIIDEGSIDSTVIVIRLKNPGLVGDLYQLCLKLGYASTFTYDSIYGNLYILRDGMKILFQDYKKLIKKYPVTNLGKIHIKIEDGLKIYQRKIYKKVGNKEKILNLLKSEDLTVNQLSSKINMTRQGVRWHINNLLNDGVIELKRMVRGKVEGMLGSINYLYGVK